MSNIVSATFKTGQATNDALLKLESAGFTEKQISLVTTDNSAGKTFNIEQTNKAPEGGFIGATSGGIIGAIAGGLAATGAIAIPGVNVLVYGTLIASAAGAAAGGATGGLVGSLIGLGIPEYEAKRYEDEIKNGSTLITVEADSSDRADRAKEIFGKVDAHNIKA